MVKSLARDTDTMRLSLAFVAIVVAMAAQEVTAFAGPAAPACVTVSRTSGRVSFPSALATCVPREGVTRLHAKKSAVITGASGYIGKAVVREAVDQGYETFALVRDLAKVQENEKDYLAFKGANVVECDVCDPEIVANVMGQIKKQTGVIDTIVSCLASRTGGKKDVYKIDYQATLNCLEAGQKYAKGGHFVLLSAFCVGKPTLEFHSAKLKFEEALQQQEDMNWSIVRPTAYFKSVSGQFENMRKGNAALLFGGGEIARCNPMAESDLATYMMDCATIPERNKKILNIGGTGKPVTHRDYNTMLFNVLEVEPQFVYVPIALFDVLIFIVQGLATISGSEKLEDAAETIRILRYYSTESMLTTDPSETFGSIQLEDFYAKIAKEGQDYDPYVSVLVRKQTAEENSSMNYYSDSSTNDSNSNKALNGTVAEPL